MKTKVTSKGQITIPESIRRKYNIKVGDELEFKDEGKYLRITKKVNEKEMRSTQGILKQGITDSVASVLEQTRGKVDLP